MAKPEVVTVLSLVCNAKFIVKDRRPNWSARFNTEAATFHLLIAERRCTAVHPHVPKIPMTLAAVDRVQQFVKFNQDGAIAAAASSCRRPLEIDSSREA